jgi:uncharacterized protein YegP (UPF0339 family)
MPGGFDFTIHDNGTFAFSLKSEEGASLLRSETDESKAAAENGIASVQKNSPLDERYELKESSDGRFFFNLKAGNHQVIGTSSLYKTAEDRAVAIELTKACGSAEVVKA